MVKLVSNHPMICWMDQQFTLEVYQINKPPMHNVIALGHSQRSSQRQKGV